MHVVYFAHGYRPREAPFASFFSTLMTKSGMLPELDPPSGTVNAAKLARHLSYASAMVAVIARRDNGPSPHIMFEVSLALRSGKPLLAFVEDTLPSGLLPSRVIQWRFSGQSYRREIREHVQALSLLRSYLGEDGCPRYPISGEQKKCLLAGCSALSGEHFSGIADLLARRGYGVLAFRDAEGPADLGPADIFEARHASLMLSIIDDPRPLDTYLGGAAAAAGVPTIEVSSRPDSPVVPEVPVDYQRIVVSSSDVQEALTQIDLQLECFEQDFVELDTPDKAKAYEDILATLSAGARYTDGVRADAVSVLEMELRVLAEQLGAVRQELARRDPSPEVQDAQKAVDEAEKAALRGDRSSAFKWVRRGGSIVQDIATRAAAGLIVAIATRNFVS